MREDMLAKVGAHNTDTIGYQVSDLDNFDFYRETDQLDVHDVSRPGIDTPVSPTTLDDLKMGGSAENPIRLDEEEDKGDSPPTTPVSERPTRTPALLGSRPVGTGIEKVSDYVYRCLFQ